MLLLFCGTSIAQINFFECAKDPSKCKNQSIDLISEKNIAEQKKNIEAELRAKMAKELESKLAEEMRLRNIKENERVESELRKSISEEVEKKYAEQARELEIRKLGRQSIIDTSIRIPTLPTKKALVIGNDSYQYVSKLDNARADSNAMAVSLANLGYQVSVKNDLNEKEMKAAIRQLKADVNSKDEVVIFYAGHGIQLGSTNYLLPIDIKADSEDQVKDDAIQLQKILDDMSEKNVKFTLALIDACRDNPFPKRGRAIGGRGLAPTTAASGQMIVFSAGSGQQAMDRLGPDDKDPNGLFTRVLLKEMYAAGTRIDNVIREVRKKVVETAKSVGHEQVPAIYDQVVGDFYFIPEK